MTCLGRTDSEEHERHVTWMCLVAVQLILSGGIQVKTGDK